MISMLRIADWTPEYFIANRSNCKLILESADALREIPLLNEAPIHNFNDRQLIRFRGMIQDMHNPEYYFQEFEVKNTQTGVTEIRSGMYADCARCSPNEEIILESEKNKNSERQTCIVISTPGLNIWARKKVKYIQDTVVSTANSCTFKRNLDEDKCEDMDCSEPLQKRERIGSTDNNTKIDTTENTTKCIVSKEHLLNFPIPIDDGKACIVKIYEEATIKLNQIVELIGFISLDPLLSVTPHTVDTMNVAEINTHNPPASLVPRLHVIKLNQLAKHEIPNAPEIVSKAQGIRKDLHLILSQLLFGDELAADYLICHLLSSMYIRFQYLNSTLEKNAFINLLRVFSSYMRRDFFCLGTFPLNITSFPVAKYKRFPKDFYNFLTLLIKKSHLLDITLENLNDLALLPKKDYECNRLTSGVLQLSDHTHLVLDETELTSGQVSQAGRENYNAICNLINFQRVTYDFKFYKMEYEADIPVLIFSEVKSFIPCPMQVKLKVDTDAENIYPQVLEIANQYLKDDTRLHNIRHYLEVLRHTEFRFNEDIVETVQEDFIQMRQINKNINVDHLHMLMILARLLSLSHGSDTLTIDYWKRAVQMEMERISRLPQQIQI